MTSDGAPARPLWDRVEEIRVSRGLSKVKVARMAGIDRQTIANWKTQPRPPMAETVVEVAHALGIPRAEALWLAGIGREPSEAPQEQAPALGAQDELISRLDRIRADPARRELLERYLDLLDPSSGG